MGNATVPDYTFLVIQFLGDRNQRESSLLGVRFSSALWRKCSILLVMATLLCAQLPPVYGSSFHETKGATKQTSTEESADAGIFSDLSTTHDGGVANPTDGSTGNALQQTLIDAYFWGVAHGGARATVVAASEYPVSGSRILIPGNVDLVCSSYSPQTYTGGCSVTQTDAGNNTASGGSPLFVADYSIGVLADHKTKCSTYDSPAQPGCTIINSSGGSISGFTLYGAGGGAGGADVGIRVAADNFSVQDTAITGFFGGPGIQNVTGVNNSYDWNYGTNVDEWWCSNPGAITSATLNSALQIADGSLGGMDLSMTDGEASHNQYSTGCAFSRGFAASLEYPYLAAMHVDGSGDLIQDNLLQVDDIGLITNGSEERVIANRVEYHAREAILNNAGNSQFSDNHILSACLDPNLTTLRPGAPNNGIPLYPSSATSLHPGYLVMDSNGNVEQVVSGNQAYGFGMSSVSVPDWGTSVGDTVQTSHLIWENMGPWIPGLTDRTDSGSAPAMTSGDCFGVKDLGQNNTWSANQVGEEAGVDGPSYYRGSYFIPYPGSLTGNTCDQDQPDANGNGQCWWGGDQFANGGPPGLQANGKMISAAGGGTAWVGDYSVLLLTDTSPKTYNNFQGMSDGQFFWITSANVADVIDTWGVNGSGGVYGHPSLHTCGGVPLTIQPNSYYEFYYSFSDSWGINQVNCPTQPDDGTLSLSPSALTFSSQTLGTTSTVKVATLTNPSSVPVTLSIATTTGFAQSSNCGTALAPGASCAISVTFTPTVVGTLTGTLTTTNGLNGAAYMISLSGTGSAVAIISGSGSQPKTIQVSSTTPSITIASSGSTATAPLVISSVGGFAGNVALTCSVVNQATGAAAEVPTCSLTPSQAYLTENAQTLGSVVVSVPTTTASIPRSNGMFPPRYLLSGLLFAGLLSGIRKRKSILVTCLCILTICGMTGCGVVTNKSGGTGSYQVKVVATSGTLTGSVTIPLTVQ